MLLLIVYTSDNKSSHFSHIYPFLFLAQKIKPLLISLSEKQDHLNSKETALQGLLSDLEADEQKLEILQDEIEKIEQEKTQLSQDKETCRQKLDRGIKLIGNSEN